MNKNKENTKEEKKEEFDLNKLFTDEIEHDMSFKEIEKREIIEKERLGIMTILDYIKLKTKSNNYVWKPIKIIGINDTGDKKKIIKKK